MDNQAQVATLKEEGNALHLQGHCEAAKVKYTEAIKLDGNNAILYANRAATHLVLKEYLDAAFDAKKAITIDPKYGKAWARYARAAEALNAHPVAVRALKEALATLPASDLTPTEEQLKAQYEENLRIAEAVVQRRRAEVQGEQGGLNVAPLDPNVKRPWQRALEMEAELARNDIFNTSAWAIMNAYKDFSEGDRLLKEVKETDEGYTGSVQVLQYISNGIMRDDRVFMVDTADWFERFAKQVSFESSVKGGWPQSDADAVKEELLKLANEGNWFSVRAALSTTIRAWFMRGYFADKSGESAALALQYYNSAISVLEWGAKTWHDIPNTQRGAVFQKTFVRGIKRFRMNAYLTAYKKSEGSSDYNLEELMAMADDMIKETNENVPRPGQRNDDEFVGDKGAWYSFFVFPVADAYSCLAAAFMERGLQEKDEKSPEADTMLATAAKFYIKAAEKFPSDDENYPFFLKIALEAQWHRGRPLREALELCTRIRSALPAVNRIWEHSTSGKLEIHLPQLDAFEGNAYGGLLEGSLTMDTPASSVPFHQFGEPAA